jgi:hypothetical protein
MGLPWLLEAGFIASFHHACHVHVQFVFWSGRQPTAFESQ